MTITVIAVLPLLKNAVILSLLVHTTTDLNINDRIFNVLKIFRSIIKSGPKVAIFEGQAEIVDD